MMNDMTRRSFVQMSGALAAAAALAGCGGGAASSAADSSATSATSAAPADSGLAFKLGGIGPVTGAAAIYGTATKNGAQVAVDAINKAAGATIFELNWQDDEHDAEKAVNAYNNLKDWGMQVLVGTTTTTPCVAVSSVSNADRIFQLTPSASSVDVIGGVDGTNEPRKDNVFQMCFTDPNQGVASAQYIAKQKLGTKIAVIYNNADAYSTGIYNKFMEEAGTQQLDVVSETTFTDDTVDFSVQVGDAKKAGADLLFLPMYYTPASLILAEAKKQSYTPKFFGVDGMDGILTLEGFDTSLAEGVMLLTPFVASATDTNTQEFVKAYKELTGTDEDPNQFAADAFDCVGAIYGALTLIKAESTATAPELCEKLIAAFTDPAFSYEGITGTATWSATGEVSKTPKGMVIQNGVYVSMD